MEEIASGQAFPGDMMQIDLVGQFNSPVFKNVWLPSMFSQYLFAAPISSKATEKVAKTFISYQKKIATFRKHFWWI